MWQPWKGNNNTVMQSGDMDLLDGWSLEQEQGFPVWPA